MLKMRYWRKKGKHYNVVFLNCGHLNENENYEKTLICIYVEKKQKLQ